MMCENVSWFQQFSEELLPKRKMKNNETVTMYEQP